MTVWLLSAKDSTRELIRTGTKATLVEVFATGGSLVEAVTSLARLRPDLIFVDFTTADDALRALQFIKGSPQIARVPVITITDLGRDSDTATIFGCDGVLRQPFSADDVATMIVPLLQRSRW